MRVRAVLFATLAIGAVSAGAYALAERSALWIEANTRQRLETGLAEAGQGWAEIGVDGLNVRVAGAAPDETSRFRAIETVHQIVDKRRVRDATTLAAPAPAAPTFALELLRNDADVSLIGLVPEAGGREVIGAALRAGGLGDKVADMLESAADPAPAGWREALGFALAAIAELPRAKISVAPGAVTIIAVADSDPEREALEARLRAAAPPDVALTLEISAPRPVIAPFAFVIEREGDAAQLLDCSAEDEAAAAAILAAARAAGAGTDATCAVGLGAPSPDWQRAVAAGLDALGALGGGRFVLRDLAAELTPPDDAAPEHVREVGAALGAALPDVFQLATAMPPQTARGPEGETIYAPRFTAELGPRGEVTLSGPVPDATSGSAITSFAAALFGSDRIMDQTNLDAALPEGWPVRVLAGVEALSSLGEGSVTVTREQVAIEGWGIDERVADRVRSLLEQKVGVGVRVDVSFNAEAAAAAELAQRPRPEICADQISAILEAGSIGFTAGSAEILPDSAGMLAAIADVLRGCPGAEFEIAGHTDGQGGEAANQELSERRAEAVVAALRAQDLPLVTLTARGYGASQPIADNETGDGRARNRRIEFVLGPAEPVAEPAAPTGTIEAAVPTCIGAVDAILAASSIVFDAGSAAITEASLPVVDEIGTALEACPDAAIEVGGHTDSQGSEVGNQLLSEQRAEAVVTALRTDSRPLAGLVARGYGEAAPIADNATAEGRAQNRRIAFVALPTSGAADQAAAATMADVACAEHITGLLAEAGIGFDDGTATISAASAPAVAAVAEVLGTCPEAELEIGDHTNTEADAEADRALSQSRADAVLAALRAGGLPLPSVTAVGFGEAAPAGATGDAGAAAPPQITVTALATENLEEVGSDDGSQ